MLLSTDVQENNPTQHKILKAAEKEFIDKGYDGARTTSIAAAAGVTHAMLHYYFRTKENLFRYILEDKVKYLKGMMLTRILDSEAPLLENIKSVIESHLDFLAANPDFPKFMLSVMSGNPKFSALFQEIVGRDNKDVLSILQEKIDISASRGECRQVDAKMLFIDITSLNIFTFIGAPLINAIVNIHIDDEFIAQRKKNNIELIMLKLKP